jgi:hypothetical protein
VIFFPVLSAFVLIVFWRDIFIPWAFAFFFQLENKHTRSKMKCLCPPKLLSFRTP